jgi:hypothetical protein
MGAAKSDLALRYIFGDGVPVNLQRARDLFMESDKENGHEPLADFILCQMVDILILCGLPSDVFEHVMANPARRKIFTEFITTPLKLPVSGSSLEIAKALQNGIRTLNRGDDGGYNLHHLTAIVDIWQKTFGSVYYGEKYRRGDLSDFYKPQILEWIRYDQRTFGTEIDVFRDMVLASCFNPEYAYQLYCTAIKCFTAPYSKNPYRPNK